MTRIFVSYRRDDSAPTTERIVDWIARAFGRRSVFQDVLSIPAGTDFRRHIAQAIRGSNVQVVVIGPRWLEARDPGGERRIDQEDDSVRVEIETAFSVGTPVVPLLVDGARMPTMEQLPWGLRELAGINALRVRHNPDFAADMAAVVAAIRRVGVSPLRRRIAATLSRQGRTHRAESPHSRLRLAELAAVLAIVVALAGVLALGRPGGLLGRPTPTPVTMPAIDPAPVEAIITVDPRGLLSGDPAAINAAQAQVRQMAALRGRYAFDYFTTVGLASPRQTAYALDVAHAFDEEVIFALGARGFVFQQAVPIDFYDPDLAPSQVELKIYLFTSKPPGV
ncbi:MAG TPA: toll/interleukin-1 receptor domain-containing protein [Ktedonobacterales bacterium]